MYALKGKDGVFSSLKGIVQDIQIEDVFYISKTTFQYKNENEGPVEMEYLFPKPTDSSISNVVVKITDPKTGKTRTLVAEIEEKEIAEEKYDDAISSGNTAVLMKHSSKSPASSSLILGNVTPNSEISVTFERVQELLIESRKIRSSGDILTVLSCSIPAMHVSKDYGASQSAIGGVSMKIMKVNVNFQSKEGKLLEVKSPSHGLSNLNIITEDEALNRMKISTIENISNEDNFSLDFVMGDYPICRWFHDSFSPNLNSHYVSFLPQFKNDESKKEKHEIIFIVDRSGSMSGSRMKWTVEALKLVLYSLDEDDQILFNIVSFGSEHKSLFPNSVLFNEQTFKQAVKECETMKADMGGTQMLNPLKVSISGRPKREEYIRNIFLLTDGEDQSPTSTMDYILEHKEKCRIYSFGIGQGINPTFLTELSSYTNGRAVFIRENDMIEELVMGQVERTLQSMIQGIDVIFPEILEKTSMFDVDHQQVQLLDPKCKHIKSDHILNFTRLSKSYLSRTKMNFEEEDEDHPIIKLEVQYRNEKHGFEIKPKSNALCSRIVGQRRIRNLESRARILLKKKNNKNKEIKKLKEEIGKLGKLFHLLTSQTSFIMVSENDVKVNKELMVEVIPTILFTHLKEEDQSIKKRIKEIEEENIRKIEQARKRREEEKRRKEEEERKRKEEEERRRIEQERRAKMKKNNPQVSKVYSTTSASSSYSYSGGIDPDMQALIIQHETFTSKSGFSGDTSEISEVRSIIGRTKIPTNNLKDVVIGDEANDMRDTHKVKSIMEHGMIVNWNNMEKLWHHIFYNDLKVTPEEHPVFISHQPLTPKNNREKATSIMFETFNVPALYDKSSHPVLVLYASGRTTGIVLDSGYEVTHAAPIYEGYALPHAILRKNIGGKQITEELIKLLSQSKKYELTTFDEKELARDIKEKICYVSRDFKKENSNSDEKIMDYTLPDGSKMHIGKEVFQSTENVLFSSYKDIGDDDGVSDLLNLSVKKCDVDIRNDLFQNILLGGGNTLFDGMTERIQSDVSKISGRSGVGKHIVKVKSPDERKYSSWIGGSILSSLSTFQNMWTTKDEYDDAGATIVHRKCFGGGGGGGGGYSSSRTNYSTSSFSYSTTSKVPKVSKEKEEEEEDEGESVVDDDDVLEKIHTSIDINKLLFCVNVKGVWKCNEKCLGAIGCSLDDILKFLPKEGFNDLWMTAIVIVILGKYFHNQIGKWRMIVKKSKKMLEKNECLEEFLDKAKKFVDKMKL